MKNTNGNDKAENSPKKSSFLEKVAKSTFDKLSTDKQKIAFANALKKSITLDISSTSYPNPKTVDYITDRYGFNIEAQLEYFLSVNKQTAKVFLKDMNYPIKSSFDTVYNTKKYFADFNRLPFVRGKRQMILTYAEWLHFVKFPFEPEYPEFLNGFLK